MEDNVIDFGKRLADRPASATGFLGCPVCHGNDLAVSCGGFPGRPYVESIVCAACDPAVIIEVVHGWLGEVRREDLTVASEDQ